MSFHPMTGTRYGCTRNTLSNSSRDATRSGSSSPIASSRNTTSRSRSHSSSGNDGWNTASVSTSRPSKALSAGITTWKTVRSFDVYALISPPASAMAVEISPTARVGVPLKTMCSR